MRFCSNLFGRKQRKMEPNGIQYQNVPTEGINYHCLLYQKSLWIDYLEHLVQLSAHEWSQRWYATWKLTWTRTETRTWISLQNQNLRNLAPGTQSMCWRVRTDMVAKKKVGESLSRRSSATELRSPAPRGRSYIFAQDAGRSPRSRSRAKSTIWQGVVSDVSTTRRGATGNAGMSLQ